MVFKAERINNSPLCDDVAPLDEAGRVRALGAGRGHLAGRSHLSLLPLVLGAQEADGQMGPLGLSRRR